MTTNRTSGWGWGTDAMSDVSCSPDDCYIWTLTSFVIQHNSRWITLNLVKVLTMILLGTGAYGQGRSKSQMRIDYFGSVKEPKESLSLSVSPSVR